MSYNFHHYPRRWLQVVKMKQRNTKARFKIRSIFLFVNLTVLFLPLFGVIFFRFYENQLVKQTESELISQAAVLSATYKQYLRKSTLRVPDDFGTDIVNEKPVTEDYYTPVLPQADLFASDILPSRPQGVMVDDPQDDLTQLAKAKKQETPDNKEETMEMAAAPPPAAAPAPREDTLSVVGSRVRGRTAMDNNVPADVIQAENAKPTREELVSGIADEMLPIIIDAQKTTLSGIKILDQNGTVVAGRNEIGLNFSHIEEVSIALSGEYHSLIRERMTDNPMPAIASISRGAGIRLFVAFPILEDDQLWGVVYLSRTPQNILKHIYENREKMALILFSLLLLTMLLAWLTSYTISWPINRLIGRVRRFTNGEVAAIEPMTSPGVKEIEVLSKSFNKMAHTINDRAKYIREFAMSVSHEFKTPITSIQGSAELILEHLDDMESGEKEKFLNNIIVDSDRLKRLISRLLELAKADNFVPTTETTSLRDPLSALKERYKDFDLELNFTIDQDYKVLIAREHFETILVNLLDNAVQNDAHVITIRASDRYGFITLELSDDGTGISDANQKQVFESFFTTKRENGGTGLGLGIVQSLLNAHNGSIELMASEQGATFKITLPVSM